MLDVDGIYLAAGHLEAKKKSGGTSCTHMGFIDGHTSVQVELMVVLNACGTRVSFMLR